MKDKYEISIWEDCLDYGSGVGSIGNYEFYGANVPAGYATSTFPDKKIAVIGSDTMTSPCRAEEPKLVQNINGTNTFTFKMRYVYNDHGEEKKNPFLSLLVNERKIKVFWKNEWYDLVIKDCQENSSDKSITYTCKDLFINELSKNGFNLEFDTELMNNTGSAQELAAAVLEGTDWEVDEQNSDIIFQESEEPVYEGRVANNEATEQGILALGLDRSDGNEEDVMIYPNQKILVYSSVFENKSSNFQFHWAGNDQFETEGSNMLVTNGRCLRLDGCSWTTSGNNIYVKNGENILFVIPSSSISLNYRAKRLIASQLVEADQLTGKQCLVYESTTLPKEKYYAFSETEYSSANLVTNCITNNKDFVNTLGWFYDGVVSTVYPAITDPGYANGKGYLYLPNGAVAFNSGIQDFHTFLPNGFSKGEQYMFRIKAMSSEDNKPTGRYCDRYPHSDVSNSVLHILPIIASYTYDSQTKQYVPDTTDQYFEVTSLSQIADWIEFTLTCTKSASYNELVNIPGHLGIGLFIDNNQSSTQAYPYNSIPIWIENVMFFKITKGAPIIHQEYAANHTYMENDYLKYNNYYYRCIRQTIGHTPSTNPSSSPVWDNYWFCYSSEPTEATVYPGSYNTSSLANVVWKIYQVKSSVTDPEDIVYLFSGSEEDFNDFVDDGSNHITPSYGPHGKYEKVRSITGKQSNRFNLLQSIAETFQVWIKFVIGHDAVGHTRIVGGKPDKKIVFLNEVGTRNGLSFTYGIDLKSITRTINSDQITTKVIVSQNNNEFGKDGFCSIARAKDNYPMVNYILNFDYYFSHNLLSKDIVMNDLYYTPANVDIINDGAQYFGYYTRLHVFNKRYDDAAQILLARNNEYVKSTSKKTYFEATIKSANQEIDKLKNDLANYAGYQTYDEAKVKEYLNGRGTTDEVAQNAWKTLLATEGQLEVYEAQKSNIDIIIGKLTVIIQEQTRIQQESVDKIKQIDDKFFSKYAHFLQEGSWSSDQYYDDDLYYFDALSTSYTSSRPQVSYNISVLRISSIKGFENKVFHLGDISYVQDTEFFGYQADGITPYKEKVLISELTSNFDAPQNDAIKVQNYKTQFEDLFQRIAAATQSLQFSSGAYDNTVNNFTHGGTLKGDSLQGSIDENDGLSWAADNDTVLFTKEGLYIMDPQNPAKIVKITADGIQFTEDGGATWSPAITGKGTEVGSIGSGIINADRISILNGNSPTFNWNSYGINAYSFEEENNQVSSVDDKKFVRFDRFGLYGVDKTEDSRFDPDWHPASESEVKTNGNFGLTWDGFFLKTNHAFTKDGVDHHTTVEISSDNDIAIIDDTDPSNTIERVKIGDISDNGETGNFGVQINNADGGSVFFTDQDGNLQVHSVLTVGPYYDREALVRISPYKPTRTYSSDRLYYPNECVTYDSYYYRCGQKTIGNTPSSISDYWIQLWPITATTAPSGDPNPPGEKEVLNACNSFIVYADGHVVAKDIIIEGGSIDASASIIGEIGGFRVNGNQLVSTNATGPVLILNGGAGTISGLYTEVTGTLTSGSTSITLSSTCIESTSKVMPWFSEYGVVAKTMEIDNGHVTMTFDARQTDLGIKLEVR